MKANKRKNQIQKFVSIRKIAERLNPVIIQNILLWVKQNKSKTALTKLIAKDDLEQLWYVL